MPASVEENILGLRSNMAQTSIGWSSCACVSPKFRPDEKIGYIAHCCDGLRLHLADGRIETDSNNVEDLIRTVALDRNTALFAGHVDGVASLGMITSLIETGKPKSIDPLARLKATRDAITADRTNRHLDELLRQNSDSLVKLTHTGGAASDFHQR